MSATRDSVLNWKDALNINEIAMLYTAVCFVIAIIAAIFGFSGIAAGAAGIAKVLFVFFVTIFILGLIMVVGTGRRRY